jgi:hypothetical protein
LSRGCAAGGLSGPQHSRVGTLGSSGLVTPQPAQYCTPALRRNRTAPPQ